MSRSGAAVSAGSSAAGDPFGPLLASAGYVYSRDQAVRSLPVNWPGTALANPQQFRASASAATPQADGLDGYLLQLLPVAAGGLSAPAGQAPLLVRTVGQGLPTLALDQAEPYYVPGINPGQAYLNHGLYTLTYSSTDSIASARFWTRVGGSVRLRVDGEYVSLTPSSVGAGSAFVTFTADFGADGVKSRRIEWECRHGALFSSIFIGPSGGAQLASPIETPSLYALGDSFFDGTGGTQAGFEDMVHLLAARLGIEKVTVDALGGTGYVKTNGAFPNYQTRIAANIAQCKPTIVVVGGSINDGTGVVAPYTNLPPAATAVYDAIAAAAPSAKLFVFTFVTRRQGDGTVQQNIVDGNGAILQAAAAHSKVAGYRDLHYLITGFGYAGNTTGFGSGDTFVTTDKTHPAPAGHEAIAREMAATIRARLESSVALPSVTPSAGGNGPTVQDTFNDVTDTALTAHTGEIGAVWAMSTSAAWSAGTFAISSAGRVKSSNASAGVAYASGVPSDADYRVAADFVFVTNPAGPAKGITIRTDTAADTMYQLFFSGGAWNLKRRVAGAATTVGSANQTISAGTIKHAEIQIVGAAITVLVDGVSIITYTDPTPIAAAGRGGIITSGTADTDTTGIHIDNFVVYG